MADNERMGEIRVADAEREKAIQVANATQAPRDRHPRGQARTGRPRGRAGQGAADRRKDGRLRARVAGQDRRARHAHPAGRRRRPGDRGRKPGQGRTSSPRRPPCRSSRPRPTSSARPSKREAEAAVLEAQHMAMAKAAIAEAQRIEAEQRAALEAPAKAEKANVVVAAEAEAETPPHRGPGPGLRDLRQARRRSPRPVRNPGQEGRGPEADHRRLRRCPAGLPTDDAGALRPPRRGLGQGHLQHQVRQGRGLGRGRAAERHTAPRPTGCTAWPAPCRR